MRSEESADNIERLILMELVEDAENFLFAAPIEAVPAFCFEGRGAVLREFFKV